MFVLQTAARRSGPPPGARRAQASPLFLSKDSRPPASELLARDSSSPRIGRLSCGDPRRTGGCRLGCFLGSLSSKLVPVVSQGGAGAHLFDRGGVWKKTKRLEREKRNQRRTPLFRFRRINEKAPPLGCMFTVLWWLNWGLLANCYSCRHLLIGI